MKKIKGFLKGGRAYLEHGKTIIEIPKQMIYIDKEGDHRLVDTLTNTGNLTVRDGLKSIKFVPIDDMKFVVDKGDKIEYIKPKTKEEKKKIKEEEERRLKLEEKIRNMISQKIREAKTFQEKYELYEQFRTDDNLNTPFINGLDKVKNWKIKFYNKYKDKIIEIKNKAETERADKLIEKYARNNKQIVKDLEKGYIDKLPKTKKALLDLIEYNQRPSDSQFENLKMLIVRFVAIRRDMYQSIKEDIDVEYNAVRVKALNNIIKYISVYLAKYENDRKQVGTKKKVREEVKKDVEEDTKVKKDESKKLPNSHKFFYRFKKSGENDQDFYEDLITKTQEFLKRMKDKPNKTREELNNIDDLEYKLDFDVAPMMKEKYGWDVTHDSIDKDEWNFDPRKRFG